MSTRQSPGCDGRERAITSQFDVPATAVAQISSSDHLLDQVHDVSISRPGSIPAICVSQSLMEDARDQHLDESSLILGLANCGDTRTNSALYAWVNNGPQDVAGRPGTGMIKEREALHLWEADDLVNRSHLYEPIQFENLLHLWEANDLMNYPQPFEPLDLGWLDNLNGGIDQADGAI